MLGRKPSEGGRTAIELQSSIVHLARFLGAQEDEVVQLLEEGRLGGALIVAITERGLPATPAVKNSVEKMVRTIDPKVALARSKANRSHMLAAEATATIMFTDIVGSSAMAERLGDRAAREVLRSHNDIIRSKTNAHGGVEVKFMGDGFMLTFPSARSGVACAVDVQRELDARNRESAEDRLAARIGLSVGEPIREEEDLFGQAVNHAARVADQAAGGQVLISEIVYALVGRAGQFRFREMGLFELKGISGTHSLYEVLWNGG